MILASQDLKDFKVSLANKVRLETLALMVFLVALVLLDHPDHKDLKATRDLLAHLVNQDLMALLATLAFKDSLVCIANYKPFLDHNFQLPSCNYNFRRNSFIMCSHYQYK